LKHRQHPSLLVFTSSFPNSPDDETCGYIRDFARALSSDFEVTVLAPADHNAARWPTDLFTLQRSRSILPGLDPFQAGDDLNRLREASLFARFATLLSLGCFFYRALSLSLKADVVCSHWMFPCGFIGALICRLLRKPHVVVEHSGAIHLLAKIRGGKTIARLVVKGSGQIVVVSADLKRKLIDICPEANDVTCVIPMGVDSKFSHCVQIDEPAKRTAQVRPSTILFIGRLTKIKGLDVLLRAARGLNNVRLIVAGDGECRDELEQLARKLSANATFLGRVNAAQRQHLLSRCDAVVIPSRILSDGRTEGTPVVFMEAIAAGRVVIAANVGGLADTIADNHNGLLFEPEDYVNLRERLRAVLGDKQLRQSIETEARRTSADYRWERIGSRYSQLIKEALKKNGVIGNRRIEVSGAGN
jgi:glycosyltransferase involved in cell wall biosynthesis